jgi:Domain of unknown function (DUF4159)
MGRKLALIAVVGVLVFFVARSGFPQNSPEEMEALWADLTSHRQPPKDTEFRFVRVRFTSHGPGRGRGFGGMYPCNPDGGPEPRRTCGWAHDYPLAEQHILQIANEATSINTNKDAYAIVNLGSDDIYKYPWGLFSEVGEMTMDANEVIHMREWLNRGGFGVADDFDGDNLEWFQDQMNKVFPGRSFVKLTIDHPIFKTFYTMPTLQTKPPYPQRGDPDYYALYDDNGRMCFILDHNNDLGDFWEWIDQPEYDLAASIEGLRFGLDYFLYALTH